MFCPKCGTNVNEGSRFCPVCGNDMAAAPQQPVYQEPAPQQPVYQEPAPQAPAYQDPAPAPMMDSMAAPMMEPAVMTPPAEAPKKSKKGLIITLSIIGAVVVALIVVGIIGYSNGWFDDLFGGGSKETTEEKECEECGDEFDGEGDLCDDCKEKEDKKDNKNDNKNNDEVKSAVCEFCGKDFEGVGYFCSDCFDGKENNTCFYCDKKLTEENIGVIAYDNFAYCEDCDTGYYCENCGAPVERGEEYCIYCGGYDDYYYDDDYYDDYYYDDYYYDYDYYDDYYDDYDYYYYS